MEITLLHGTTVIFKCSTCGLPKKAELFQHVIDKKEYLKPDFTLSCSNVLCDFLPDYNVL